MASRYVVTQTNVYESVQTPVPPRTLTLKQRLMNVFRTNTRGRSVRENSEDPSVQAPVLPLQPVARDETNTEDQPPEISSDNDAQIENVSVVKYYSRGELERVDIVRADAERVSYHKDVVESVFRLETLAIADEDSRQPQGRWTDDICCVDCCCGSITKRLRYRRKHVQTECTEEFLREVAKEGWKILNKELFPMVSNAGRMLWVIVQLVLLMINFCFSVTAFALGDKTWVDIVNVSFSITGLVLAFFDLFFTIDDINRCCESISQNNRKWRWFTDKYAEVLRMSVSEFIIYVIVITNMLIYLSGENHTTAIQVDSTEDRVRLAFLCKSAALNVINSYIVRLIVLGYTVHYTRKLVQEGNAKSSGFWFMVRFILHVFGQIVVQVLMLVAIGGKIRYENPTPGEEIRVSPYLWYMIVGAWFLPVVGVVMFFIPNYYWMQKLPLKRYINFLQTTLKERSLTELTPILGGKTHNELKIAARKVKEFVTQDLKEITDISFSYKQCYPIHFPGLAFFSYVYAAFLLVFAICCGLNTNENGDTFTGTILGGDAWWVLYFFLALFVVIIINCSNLFIFHVWTFMIVCILCIVPVVCIVTGLLIYLCILIYLYISFTTE